MSEFPIFLPSPPPRRSLLPSSYRIFAVTVNDTRIKVESGSGNVAYNNMLNCGLPWFLNGSWPEGEKLAAFIKWDVAYAGYAPYSARKTLIDLWLLSLMRVGEHPKIMGHPQEWACDIRANHRLPQDYWPVEWGRKIRANERHTMINPFMVLALVVGVCAREGVISRTCITLLWIANEAIQNWLTICFISIQFNCNSYSTQYPTPQSNKLNWIPFSFLPHSGLR